MAVLKAYEEERCQHFTWIPGRPNSVKEMLFQRTEKLNFLFLGLQPSQVLIVGHSLFKQPLPIRFTLFCFVLFCRCFACMYVSAPHACFALRGWEKVPDPSEDGVGVMDVLLAGL